MIKKLLYTTLCLLALHGCKIENDIPYPIEEASIEAFTVEGQLDSAPDGEAQAGINKDTRTVTLYVDDTVDLTKLRITRLTITPEGAEVISNPEDCVNADRFPTTGFEIPDNLADTRMDFSNPVQFTLRTYQDYVWTVNITQFIDRQVDVEGMVNAVIDAENRRAIIYVSSEQDLSNIQINTLDLEGPSGKISRDISAVHDFTSPQKFMISRGWDPDTYREWTVYVYHANETTSQASIFPMTTRATLTGSIVSGKRPEIEYKQANASSWSTLPASNVSVNGSRYTATFTGLTGSTAYQYRVTVDGVAGAEQSFTTAPATPLENGGFENWYMDDKIYVPNATGSRFWGSGNPGAASFIGNLTTPTSDAVSGQAALLESKDAVIKLGAGNIFTGDFTLDGTNGILHFGQPFTTFPTALRLYYKYTSTTINRIGEQVGALESLRGRPDSCHIYIALSDKSEPYEIRTRPSERKMFNKNDANIIAYGEFISAQTISSYQQITIPLEYRATNRTPKYIVIVCSASKYGDYFIGGEGSTLWLDEMELIYE